MRRALALKDPRFPAPQHRAEEPPRVSDHVPSSRTWTISVYHVGFAVRGPVCRKCCWHSPALAAVLLQASLWSHEKLFKFSTERLCGGTAGQPFPSSGRHRQTPGSRAGSRAEWLSGAAPGAAPGGGGPQEPQDPHTVPCTRSGTWREEPRF